MEHRWGQRRRTNVTVRFITMPSTTGLGRLLDISPTGAFMETDANLRLLSLVYLELAESDLADQSAMTGISGRLAATVVRRNAAGVGLEWCEFAAVTTQAYARLAKEWSDAHQLALPSMPDAR